MDERRHYDYNRQRFSISRTLGIELICGGFPCPSFSCAGKRGGFSDTRGTLFFDLARYVKEIKPRFLLLENVKGILSHEQGKTFAVVLNTLDELGYDAEWQVCDSQFFGVPHHRERIFIVGHLRGSSRGQIFPIRSSGKSNDIREIGSTSPPQRKIGRRDVVYHPDGSMGTLLSTDNKQPKQIIVVGNLYQGGGQAGDVLDPNGISTCLDTMQGGNRMPKIALDKPFRIRKLTPKECWRLQAFPDGHMKEPDQRTPIHSCISKVAIP